MEVDEAASHIKELVDPDANIIWGSAFNNDLDGKIRVSVVATGIDADTAAQPQPAKVFTFPTRSAPVAAAPAQDEPELDSAADDEDEETLELSNVAETGEDDDELLLDSDDILTSPVGSAPIAPPADDDTEASIGNDEPTASARPKLATGSGGTLFERMSNISKGAPAAKLDEGPEPPTSFRSEPIDIPRFLNRQNNQ
jgi:cell division protein FtsZ